MNVLSLFDGMSCGQIALDRVGIKYYKYFSSEIDKYTIKVTQANYSNTIQLGDVIQLYNWHLPRVDLLLGGSPCQGFSRAGKGLDWADPRSQLFFWYVHALRFHKPKYFLFENVMMKKEIKDAISYELGVEPIIINSALVSAQSRKRLYWTNISNVDQPEDKGIYLKDIIEDGYVDRDKSYCVSGNVARPTLKMYLKSRRGQIVFNSLRCIQTGVADLKGYDIVKRTYDIEGKSPTLTSMGGGHREPKITIGKESWRKLTPLECERLQTVPDNYTNHVSNTQRYKMLGNGWTIDVIAHILKHMF